MANREIYKWQLRFKEQPAVWLTTVDGEYTGNVYDSRQAAEREVEWRKRKKGRGRPGIIKLHIHNDKLSAERWT